MKTLSTTTVKPLTVINPLVDEETGLIGDVDTTTTSLGLSPLQDGWIQVANEVVNPLNGDLTNLTQITDPLSSVSSTDISTLSVLETAINSLIVNLQDFAQQPDFTDNMELAFGQGVNVLGLQQDWANAEVSLPMIEILPSTGINGANGAFAGELNTIYLSEEFVTQNINNPETITQVLLEEFGHSVDYQLNAVDAPGDEGAIFSQVVLGHTPGETALNALKAENDTAVVVINNQAVQIEQSASTSFSAGVTDLFAELQASWQAALTNVPLFGNTLQSSSDIIGLFNGIEANIISVANFLDDASNTVDTLKNELQAKLDAFFSSLGTQAHLNATVTATVDPSNPDNLAFSLQLGGSLTFTQPLAADIGLPTLGLSIADSTAAVTLGCGLNLNFGLEGNNFYFDTAPTDDLTMTLTAALPELNATGTLGMLQFETEDVVGKDDIALSASVGVDIQDADRDNSTDNRTNFSNIDPNKELFATSFGAGAEVNLGLTTSFGADAAFPSLSTELNLAWGIGNSATATALGFNDVQLDLGSFFSDFARPILETVQTVTAPVQPVIDILQQPINLGLTTVSLLDIAKRYSGDRIAPSTWDFIDSMADVITLVNSIPTDGNIKIDLGSFDLGGTDFRSESISNAVPNITGVAASVEDQIAAKIPDGENSQAGKFITQLNSMPGEGLEFPILTDPMSVFKLLLGSQQPVDLFTYDMPKFEFSIETPDFTFPVFGPIVAKFNGELAASIDIDFGYDTQGLFDFKGHDYNPAYIPVLFNGFYINDYDDAGVEKPEVSVSGALNAGAGIDLLLLKAGVTGSIEAEIGFDLNDLTPDGKMRPSDFAALPNALCIFTTSGALTAGLNAYFTAGIWPFEYTKEFNSPRITLISFDGSCNQTKPPSDPPVLAQINNAQLQLNIGDHAADRLRVNTVDGAENFVIQHLSGVADNEQVLVSASLVDPKAIVHAQQYDGKTMIVANGGAENDIIEFRANSKDELVVTPASLSGGAGDDVLIGGAGDDLLNGDEGADKLQGKSGKDFLHGGVGDDFLDGGKDADFMEGGTGDDMYIVDNIDDVVVESSTLADEIDSVYSSISYTLGDNLENLTLTGKSMDDGSTKDEAINGTGNAKDNILIGNTANNVLDGQAGADAMQGGQGDDSYTVDNVNDIVKEFQDEGKDAVYSNITYTLTDHVEDLVLIGTAAINGTGNELNNHITGNIADNVLMGLAGDDVLDGQQGADVMKGGLGNDSYIVDNVGDKVKELKNEGQDTVYSSISYRLTRHVEDLVLTGTAAINGTGNALDNHITGNSANNTLKGLAGDDVLDGREGADVMIGGSGNDSYYVDNIGDVVKEYANEDEHHHHRDEDERHHHHRDDKEWHRHDTGGTDTVYASISYQLGANVENLVLMGTEAINGTGNELDNHLTGNSANNILEGRDGDDVLDGKEGADVMRGGEGDDSYTVDNAGDVVKEYRHDGEDTVYSTVSYTLTDHVENLVLMGTSAISGWGNASDNHLTGNGAGSILDGQAGDDNYYVSQAGDTIAESAHNGWDTVLSSINYTLENNLEELYLTGSADINGTGNAQDNNLNGNAGNNILDGGAGEDWMAGRAGNDNYIVDNTGDEVEERYNDGMDSVYSSVSYRLADNVEKLILTGSAAINGTGNDLANHLEGNSANNTLRAGDGDDVLVGGNGADILIGGDGQDTYNLTETTPATDTVRIERGESVVSSYDVITGFQLGNSLFSTIGVDRLELDSDHIAHDAVKNGQDVGMIQSHSIHDGIISFSETDSYSDALVITNNALDDVIAYLQDNIRGNNTVGFVCEANTFVFQDNGYNDTLVELVGVTANSLSNSGLANNAVWLV